MKLINLLESDIRIHSQAIKIQNGVMIPNQFPDKVFSFSCWNLKNLTSLENSPKEITQFFNCQETNITSLDGAPLKINGIMFCDETNILHLKGIGRSYLKECGSLYLPNTVKSNILGLCRVKNLNNITIRNNSANVESGDLFEAIEIVKKHLNTGGSDCQEELMQNGFNDYAKF
jgi:hypothetical protein